MLHRNAGSGQIFCHAETEIYAVSAMFTDGLPRRPMIGVYGVVAFTVSRRTKEVGIRIAPENELVEDFVCLVDDAVRRPRQDSAVDLTLERCQFCKAVRAVYTAEQAIRTPDPMRGAP